MRLEPGIQTWSVASLNTKEGCCILRGVLLSSFALGFIPRGRTHPIESVIRRDSANCCCCSLNSANNTQYQDSQIMYLYYLFIYFDSSPYFCNFNPNNSLNRMTTSDVKFMHHDLAWLDTFVRSNFRCWQQKVLFLLTYMKIAFVLTKPCPNCEEPPGGSHARKKWKENEYLCKSHILNLVADNIYNLYLIARIARHLESS